MMTHSGPSTVAQLPIPMKYMYMMDQTNGPQSMTMEIKVSIHGGRKISRVVLRWTRLKHDPIKVDHTYVFSTTE